MKKETKDLVELTEKWLTEIKNVTVSYTQAVGKLDNIHTTLSSQIKSRLQRVVDFLPILIPIVVLVLTYFLLQLFFYKMPCGIKLDFGSATIYKYCHPQ